MRYTYSALLLGSLLAFVGCGSDGGARGGEAPTGPTISIVTNCQTLGGRGGDQGNTTVNVGVDCPKDSNNTTKNKIE